MPQIFCLQSLADDGLHTDLLDVTEQVDVSAYFAAREDFDGLVNMAGWVHHGLTQTELADWHRSFQVNLDSMYFVLHAALPGLIRQGGGSIVNMASLASSVKGFPFRAAYSASKAAVIGLTKSVAVDYMAEAYGATPFAQEQLKHHLCMAGWSNGRKAGFRGSSERLVY